MQFSESWLRTFCNPAISSAELADVLTMSGLEVEECKPVAPNFTRVVISEVKQVLQHPNADRLRVCKVDIGHETLLDIVCGAANVRVGIRVPCALVGAELPAGENGKPALIKVGKLRGVESHGMLCSARELKLSDDHAGLMELASDAPLGVDIREYLDLDDTLFTLKLTPNLAHCLSIYGVAREVSALTGAALCAPEFPPVAVSIADQLHVKISAPDLCGRFSGRVIRNVNMKAKTPQWMVDRLSRCGQRSVNILVDISNYVMFEFGRPTHIFDLDKITGGLEVRWAKPGEQLKLLNGSTVVLEENMGIIADDVQVESLAGIMGGDATAVSISTKDIFIEAAFWWPKSIAGRSRRLNFSTDAGHRFERGVDPNQTVEHIEYITKLILEICGTEQTQCGPINDVRGRLPESQPVTMRVTRAQKVIGMQLTQEQCVLALSRLGLSVQEAEGLITVVPPSYRFDLRIEEDLIEEVARMVGYQQLPHTPPLAPITAKLRPENRRTPYAVRRNLASLGYQETINFSFVDAQIEEQLQANPNPIKLLNPIASHMGVLRSSLIGSLLQVLRFNIAHKTTRVRVFEIGRIFKRDSNIGDSDTTVEGFDQPMRVAGLAFGSADSLQWGVKEQDIDFFDVKGDVEALLAPMCAEFAPCQHPALHPGRSAQIYLHGALIGHVGEIHPKWCQSYGLVSTPIVFELELNALLQRRVPVFLPVPKFQTVLRDIAVVVPDDVSYTSLVQAVRSAPTHGLLQDVQLFDVYRPKLPKEHAGVPAGVERSMALRLTLRSDEATLTEDQIETAVRAVLDQLVDTLGVRQRI